MITNETQEKILSEIKKEIGERAYAVLYSVVVCKHKVVDEKNVFFVEVPSPYFKLKIEEHLTLLQDLTKAEGFSEVEIIINKKKSLSRAEEEHKIDPTGSSLPHARAAFYFGGKTIQSQNALRDTKVAIQETKKTLKKKDYIFENFITGPTNEFAASVAVAVAKNIGTAYNPCLIYGPVGLGKTHLLKAVGHEVLVQNPHAKVLYLTSEQLINAFTDAIRTRKTKEFQNLTRTQDVILIDDIQFFSGKEGFQEEMFHIFNVLSNEEKQMVFASDRSVSKIKDLQDRLASRFQSGIGADLQPPTMEMAISIMENYLVKSKKEDLISKEQLYFIAEHIRSNIRDMLAFLVRVVDYGKMTKKEVTLDDIKKWAQDYKPKSVQVDYNKMLQATARHFTISIDDLKSKKRTRKMAHARHVAMYLIRKHANLSFTEISKLFGLSHVAASRAYNTLVADLSIGADISHDIEEIENYL